MSGDPTELTEIFISQGTETPSQFPLSMEGQSWYLQLEGWEKQGLVARYILKICWLGIKALENLEWISANVRSETVILIYCPTLFPGLLTLCPWGTRAEKACAIWSKRMFESILLFPKKQATNYFHNFWKFGSDGIIATNHPAMQHSHRIRQTI